MVGSSPVYLVASKGAKSARVVEHIGLKPPKDIPPAFQPNDGNTWFQPKPALYDAPGPGTPGMRVAKFEKYMLPKDAESGVTGLAFKLKPEGECPAVICEATEVGFKDGPKFKADATDAIGMWIKGNGSMSRFKLFFKAPSVPTGWPGWLHFTDRGNVNFDGWRYFEAKIPDMFNAGRSSTKGLELQLTGVAVGTARVALDPIEMVPVENDIAIGPVYIIPKGRAQDKSAAIQSGVEAIMKTVNDKDL